MSPPSQPCINVLLTYECLEEAQLSALNHCNSVTFPVMYTSVGLSTILPMLWCH